MDAIKDIDPVIVATLTKIYEEITEELNTRLDATQTEINERLDTLENRVISARNLVDYLKDEMNGLAWDIDGEKNFFKRAKLRRKFKETLDIHHLAQFDYLKPLKKYRKALEKAERLDKKSLFPELTKKRDIALFNLNEAKAGRFTADDVRAYIQSI